MADKSCFFLVRCLLMLALLPWIVAADYTDSYHIEPKIEPTKEEIYITQIFNRLCKKRGVEPPFWDATLTAAARPQARRVAINGMKETANLDNQDIAGAIKKFGGTDSAIRAQVANMFRLDDAEKILEKHLVEEVVSKRYTHMGVAFEKRLLSPLKYLVVILTRRPVVLEPFARRVLPGRQYSLSGSMISKVNKPRILLSKPSGTIEVIVPQVAADGTFKQPIPFAEGGGKYTIELQVNGLNGPEIASLFDVHSLADPTRAALKAPYIVVPEMPPAKTEVEAEGRLFSLVNMARESAKKVLLTRNPKLDQIARDYAREMVDRGFVGHVNPDGDDVASRVERAGLTYRRIAENVAVNETAVQAHRNLLESPAHAAMVLDNGFTEMGVGVVFKEDKTGRIVYVVEVFRTPR